MFSDDVTKTVTELMKWEHTIMSKLNLLLFLLYSLCDLWFPLGLETLASCFLSLPSEFHYSNPLTSFKSVDDYNDLFNVGPLVTVSSLAPCLVCMPFFKTHFTLT